MMDSCHRQAIARVDANRGTVPALAGCKRVRGVPTAGQISYGIEDVHAWMVARVTLMCQHLGDRIAPTMAWRTGSGEVEESTCAWRSPSRRSRRHTRLARR